MERSHESNSAVSLPAAKALRIVWTPQRLSLLLLAVLFGASALQGTRILLRAHGFQRDFRVYFTAAAMIRNHEGQHLYDQAADGTDPQLYNAEDNTLFARRAKELGMEYIELYVYPPLLADLIVPMTFLKLSSAEQAWLLVNYICVLAATLLLARLVSPGRIRRSWPALLLGVMLFRPTLDSLFLGQITVVLLLLQTAGLYFYWQGRTLAAVMFAVMTVIKLTPLIVIVPLFVFKDWKQLRAFALTIAALLIGLRLVNGEGLLRQYVEHVVPAMSTGIVSIQNRNLGTALQIAWQHTDQLPALPSINWAGKLLSLAVICYAAWLARRSMPRKSQRARNTTVLMLFFLLGCCLAPVAWRHSYVLAAPALAVLVVRAWNGRMNAVEFVPLFCVILLISGFGFTQWASNTGNAFFLDAAMLAPVAGVVMTLTLLYRRSRAGLPLNEESFL